MEMSLRDKWLSSEDSVFLRDCELSAFRASGHGGQKVNKTSSAVRLTHTPSGLSATAQESRSQSENRSLALRRLRLKIAMELRGNATPPSLDKIPSERNPAYPLFVAAFFDTLHKSAWDLKAAAAMLDVSPSKLAKELYRRPELWQETGRQRAILALPPLKAPL
jgi:hypothetical protein